MEAVNMPNRIYSKLLNEKRIELTSEEGSKKAAADEVVSEVEDYIEGGGV